jgi:hypothetical protein
MFSAAARLRSRLSRLRSETIAGIEVRGNAAFRARTREALELLGAAAAIPLVQENVAMIRQGRRSGMRAWASPPTFVVGAATWRHSALWYAGAIAHDAYHAKLYHEARRVGGGAEPAPGAWTGADAERQCLDFQYAVLKTLHGDDATLAYVSGWRQDPRYADRAGWLDYLRRGW